MKATLLDGRTLAEKIRENLKTRIDLMTQKGLPAPALATILVGSDPSSAMYVKMKGKACDSIGMRSRRIELPESTTTEQLLSCIDKLNSDSDIHGILLQHPVPSHINERAAFDSILPEKDVDGVTLTGFARTSFGLTSYGCCTPAGMIRILDEYNIPIEGKHAVVVGRSAILGKPMAMMLLQRNATVTICHSKTKDIASHIQSADIVVGALGKSEFIKGEWIKEGAVVLDAGYNDKKGDVEFDVSAERASYITPVPGGVGPMTIAILLEQTLLSAERRMGVGN